MGALGFCYIRDNPAGHFHGHERIAVDVGIGGQPKVFKSFAKAEFAPICSCQRIYRGAGEQAQASNCYRSSRDVHRISSDVMWALPVWPTFKTWDQPVQVDAYQPGTSGEKRRGSG